MFIPKLGMTLGNLIRGAVSGASPSTLINDLVSYWTLDETSGTREDSVGSNDLSDNNTVTYVAQGPSGVRAQFTAANNEYLNINTNLTPSEQSYTVAVWEWLGCSEVRILFNTTNNNQSSSYGIYAYLSNASSGSIVAQAYDSVSGNVTSQPSSPYGTVAGPQLYVFGYDASTKKSFASINGQAKTLSSTALANGLRVSDITHAAFGRSSAGGTSSEQACAGFWTGRMLSDSDILELFNNGVGMHYADLSDNLKTNLTSYWDLDEVSGNRADSHGSNTLTDNNTVTSVNSGPSGTVASFVNANNESLQASVSLAAGDYSAAFWFYNDGALTAPNGLLRITSGDGTGWADSFSAYAAGASALTLQTTNGSDYIRTPVAVPVGWNFVVIRHDQTNLRFSSSVNAETLVLENASGAGSWGTATTILVGSIGTSNSIYASNSPQGPVGLWSRLITQDEITSLFNSGIGKRYADLTDDEKTGLVSYWNLDETSGTRADSHGENDLTDNNTVGYTINAGGAMNGIASRNASATSEWLNCAVNPLSGKTSFTVATWIKFTNSTRFNMAILSITGQSNTNAFFDGFFLNDATHRMYVWDTTLGEQVYTDVHWFDSLDLNIWHHLMYTFNGDDKKLRAYRDGVLVATSSAMSGTPFFNFTPGTHGIKLGAKTFLNSTVGHTDADYDGFAIWSRVLTDDEIAELFNTGRGVFYNGSDFV